MAQNNNAQLTGETPALGDTTAFHDLRWRLDPRAATVVQRWPDESVVFDERAAQTHLLTAAAWAVFESLDRIGEASVAEILSDLGDGLHEPDADDKDTRSLRDILDSLQRCGLAESRAP